MDAFRLDGEIALVTGGGSGIGFAIAQRCAEAGASVVICGRRESVLQKVVDEIGNNVTYQVFDITDVDKIPSFLDDVRNKVGSPTILVNNAGINMIKPAVETSDEDFNRTVRTHVHCAFALTKAVAPAMLERKKGSIVFISSLSSHIGFSNMAAYSAAKSAVLGIVRTLATEWSSLGVRINAIAPGFIETPMAQKHFYGDEERKKRILIRTPIGKLGEPDDIAHAAVYLCSPAAKYVTGTTLTVDGGTSIGF